MLLFLAFINRKEIILKTKKTLKRNKNRKKDPYTCICSLSILFKFIYKILMIFFLFFFLFMFSIYYEYIYTTLRKFLNFQANYSQSLIEIICLSFFFLSLYLINAFLFCLLYHFRYFI